MRPIGLAFIGFAYLMSFGFLAANIMVFGPMGYDVYNISGDKIDIREFVETEVQASGLDTIGNRTLNQQDGGGNLLPRTTFFSQYGFESIWTLLALFSGTYFLNFMILLGLPNIFVYIVQIIYGFIVLSTVISFISGRG